MAGQVCAPWTTPDKLCCEGGGTTVDCDGVVTPLVYEWTDDEYILAASNILFARTCFLYPGVCSSQVWPCIQCGCGCHPCGCGVYSAFELPTDYDVDPLSIVVTLDGVVVPAADYRLERRNWLVRTVQDPWPPCNNFGLPTTGQAQELIVTYDHGRTPPIELQMAAAELACEIKKACNGQSCGLPDHVKSLTRRGVEFELTDLTDLLRTGSTGLPMVDHAISVHGQCPQDSMFDPARLPRGWSVS